MAVRRKDGEAVEVTYAGQLWLTDERGVLSAPDEVEASLLEQFDLWEPTEVQPYAGWKKPEFQAEALRRGLDGTGTVTDLRERLIESDAEPVSEAGVTGEEG